MYNSQGKAKSSPEGLTGGSGELASIPEKENDFDSMFKEFEHHQHADRKSTVRGSVHPSIQRKNFFESFYIFGIDKVSIGPPPKKQA